MPNQMDYNSTTNHLFDSLILFEMSDRKHLIGVGWVTRPLLVQESGASLITVSPQDNIQWGKGISIKKKIILLEKENECQVFQNKSVILLFLCEL